MKNNIILVRHAESIKNIKHIHGGQGEALTTNGLAQAKNVVQTLRKSDIDLNALRIYASTSVHTRETAKIIAEELNLSIEKPLEFRPLYFGIADGLSEEELSLRYPQIQALFEKWRRREIDIKELIIEGMESPIDFWRRGEAFLKTIPNEGNSLLVCSNSLMILLSNIMLGNHPIATNEYKHITIQNCGIIAFVKVNSTTYLLNREITNVEISTSSNL